jgi:23S rRNA pseudouridine1911/1915/1917 synthase
MKNELTFVITKAFDNKTIREFLESFHVSRKTIYKLSNGLIKLNQTTAKETNLLKTDDFLTIDFSSVIPDFPRVVSEDSIKIIYEDDHFLVVHKPELLLVYDDGNLKKSLTSNVQAYAKKMGYPCPLLPAHRIDEETSGMIIFAKHPLALSYLSYLFESKTIVKVYECLVSGPLKRSKGTMTYPIGKDRHSQKMRVSADGEDAVTHYEVIGESDDSSRLKVVIETGKKHQIRVHLAHIGYPIIGDILYHGKMNSRLMLHFKEVEFIHPFTKEKLHLVDQVPF